VVWSEKDRGLRGTASHKTQVIAGFFGSGALAVLPVHGVAFFHCFKKLAQCAKLATSYKWSDDLHEHATSQRSPHSSALLPLLYARVWQL